MGDTPRLTIRCEYPDTDLPPTEVTFRLSPSYGLTTGHEVNEWFIDMMYDYEEFEVETDEPGEPPLSFWSETCWGAASPPLAEAANPAARRPMKVLP